MHPNPLALHPHERLALARGSVVLLRPVELPEFTPSTLEAWAVNDDGLWTGYGDLGMCNGVSGALTERLPCPLGRPGDALETDAGPVVVRGRELAAQEAEAWGVLPPLPQGHVFYVPGVLRQCEIDWSAEFPAHPWERAWAWCVTVERSA